MTAAAQLVGIPFKCLGKEIVVQFHWRVDLRGTRVWMRPLKGFKAQRTSEVSFVVGHLEFGDNP